MDLRTGRGHWNGSGNCYWQPASRARSGHDRPAHPAGASGSTHGDRCSRLGKGSEGHQRLLRQIWRTFATRIAAGARAITQSAGPGRKKSPHRLTAQGYWWENPVQAFLSAAAFGLSKTCFFVSALQQHESFLSAEHSVFAAALVVAVLFVFVSLTSPA